MSYIEAICDDIALIDNGEIVLEGALNEIKKTMGEDKLRLRFEDMPNLDFLEGYNYSIQKEDIILSLSPNQTKEEFIQSLYKKGIKVSMFMDIFQVLRKYL